MTNSEFNSSTTNILTSTVVTSTPTDLGNVFCFSVCADVTATVPSGPQYVPGTICTIHASFERSIANAGVINGNGTSPYTTLNANQALVCVSVYWDNVSTHWVQIYKGPV